MCGVLSATVDALQFLKRTKPKGQFRYWQYCLNLNSPIWMTFNSSVVSRAWRLNWGHVCYFKRKDEAVSSGKLPTGNGVYGLLSWHGLHFWVWNCITFCKVRHDDSATKTRLLWLTLLIPYVDQFLMFKWTNNSHLIDDTARCAHCMCPLYSIVIRGWYAFN